MHRKTHGAVEQDIHWSGFRTNTSQKILVQLQSLALETPTVEFLASELKGLACEQALWALWWWGWKRRRACNYISKIWIPPPILLWLPVHWPDLTWPGKWKRLQIETSIEKHVPRLMMSSLTSSPPISILHQLFWCCYSNSRDITASSPSFSCPAARAPWELARNLPHTVR